jgi:hypothetical protein
MVNLIAYNPGRVGGAALPDRRGSLVRPHPLHRGTTAPNNKREFMESAPLDDFGRCKNDAAQNCDLHYPIQSTDVSTDDLDFRQSPHYTSQPVCNVFPLEHR